RPGYGAPQSGPLRHPGSPATGRDGGPALCLPRLLGPGLAQDGLQGRVPPAGGSAPLGLGTTLSPSPLVGEGGPSGSDEGCQRDGGSLGSDKETSLDTRR